MNANESLLYSVSDALQIPLVPFIGGYLGKSKQVLKVGPWTLHLEPSALSDTLSMEVTSFLIHINKDLFLYIVATEDLKHPLTAYVVNGSLVSLTTNTYKTYSTGKVADTLKKLDKGIVATYKFSTDQQKWESVN